MNSDTLKQDYEEQLLISGVDPYEAEQAANILSNLSKQELQLLCEIWPEWNSTYVVKEALI